MTQMTQDEWAKSVAWVGIVAGCVIRRDDKYLLVQEKQPSAYGLWNLPAGHVDKGETIEAAALREVREETGFDIEIVRKLPLSHDSSTTPVKHAFFAQINGGELHIPRDELLDGKWFTYQEIASLKRDGKLRGGWVWESITEVENSS